MKKAIVKLNRWSSALVIPRDMLRELKWKAGDEIALAAWRLRALEAVGKKRRKDKI